MNKFISRFRFRVSRPILIIPIFSSPNVLQLSLLNLNRERSSRQRSHHRLFDRELLITRSGEEGRRGREEKKEEKREKTEEMKKEAKERRKEKKEKREGEDVYQSEQCLAHASLFSPETSPITLEQDLSRSPCQPPSPIRFGYTTLR